MKKLIVLIFSVVSLSLNLMASTNSCKISGGQNDNATVVASIVEIGDGYVKVELSNDGDFAVNVSVKIHKEQGSDYTAATIVPAQGGKEIKVLVTGAKSGDSVSRYDITSVSGARCN